MLRRRSLLGALAATTSLLVALPAGAALHAPATTVQVRATVASTLSSNLPLVRLHFSRPVRAAKLPALVTQPPLATTWQQIGPNDVQAVATSALAPLVSYAITTPTTMHCASTCSFTTTRRLVASVATNLTWEAQLLAQLKYLPLTFTPTANATTPSQQVSGLFTWAYPNLPVTLSSQWHLGSDNIILHGALMTFQSQHNLSVTGEINPVTWNALLAAANAGATDPASYNYVDVTETLPETLTLYVAGKAIFHSLINTGISAAPTELGTYGVYSRFISTTMSGTNPDGTTYHDPDIPWVSYFNGGDALHGFIRATYGWPQSLGCVEMPFASAKTVFPYTPIGTLVTVRS